MNPRTPRVVSLSGILGWIPQIVKLSQNRFRAQIRLLGLAALVGIVAGLGAIVFYVATRVVEHYALGVLAGYYPEPRPGGEAAMSWLPVVAHPFFPWLLLLIPAVGGLVSGVLVFTFAPEAEGHGTDSVIAAYHYRQGQIRPRVPLVKIIASSITLGTGGSGGREGPIAQIGAGFGSLLGNLLRLRPAERRVLMAAGMGAGIGAIFRAPLAGTIFAGGSALRLHGVRARGHHSGGDRQRHFLLRLRHVFRLGAAVHDPPDLTFTNPLRLGPYLLLALFMALLAALYTHTFYGCKRWFDRLPIRKHFRPAIGAFLTGLVAFALYFLLGGNKQVLAVLAFGYSAIQNAMTQDANVTAGILLAIALGKILTTGLTIGSGGSGGVFGPSMVIGGCGGGALGVVLHHLWPWLVPHPASFVIVGMAGFFAAAAKTPFSTLIIVSEMTGGYHLLLPSLWVCPPLCRLSRIESSFEAAGHRSGQFRGKVAAFAILHLSTARGSGRRTGVPARSRVIACASISSLSAPSTRERISTRMRPIPSASKKNVPVSGAKLRNCRRGMWRSTTPGRKLS